MEPLAKLLVSFLDLAEAELKTLKAGVIRLGLSVIMLVAAGLFGILGLCGLLAAGYLLVEKLTRSHMTALAIIGVLFVAAAAILGVMAFGSKKVKTPVPPGPGPTPEGKPHDPAVGMRIAS